MNKPVLSLVLTGRNDNYGGDFRERLQNCMDWTHKQLTLHKIHSEIIFVNYNPLPEPSIEQFIRWEKSNEFVTLRIITVPAGVHNTLLSSGKLKNVPLLEYPAKNAGIRRATGEYILSINPDIIIPPQVFDYIQSLKKEFYYRVNRFDYVSPEGETDLSLIKQNITKIWLKDFSFSRLPAPLSRGELLKIKALQKVYFFRYNFMLFISPLLRLIWKVSYHPKAEMKYHCNVSGDFMLMHKDSWNKLKGHNEQSFLSLHTDALMVIQAAALGLNEKILSSPVYHREHERRYDANDENPDYRQAYLFFQSEAQKMLKEKKPTVYNNDDWGLNNFKLEEKTT